MLRGFLFLYGVRAAGCGRALRKLLADGFGVVGGREEAH
jgi:hypothetical protein